MIAPREAFVCGHCEGLSRARNAPPFTKHADCDRCGDSTRQYVGVVMAGVSVLTTASFFSWLGVHGQRIPDTPGVRVVGGVELYSAAWL